MSCHLTPLDVCLRIFGSAEDVARAAGYHPKSAYRWMRGGKWRREGDLPSAEVMRALLRAASQRHLPLTADHLVMGAQSDEVEALMADRGPVPIDWPADEGQGSAHMRCA